MKLSSKVLQNLKYFWNNIKTHAKRNKKAIHKMKNQNKYNIWILKI